MRRAIGMLEVLGFSVALAAIDRACKVADIQIEGIECNNPRQGEQAQIPVVIQVKFTGTVEDVKIALEVARKEAEKYIASEDILTHCIPSSLDDLDKLLPIGKVKRKMG